MEQLSRIVFCNENLGNGRLASSPIRHLTRERLDEMRAKLKGGEAYRIEADGWLTTIREFAPQVAASSGWCEAWLDEPCIAHSNDDARGVLCSGRSIVGFYDPRSMPTRRPAYIVINENPSYGPIGMRLVQSA